MSGVYVAVEPECLVVALCLRTKGRRRVVLPKIYWSFVLLSLRLPLLSHTLS